jgi:hypothetical protein
MSEVKPAPKWRSLTRKNVETVLRGARAAGLEPDEVCVRPDGEIRLLLRRGGAAAGGASEIQDELSRHFANGRF